MDVRAYRAKKENEKEQIYPPDFGMVVTSAKQTPKSGRKIRWCLHREYIKKKKKEKGYGVERFPETCIGNKFRILARQKKYIFGPLCYTFIPFFFCCVNYRLRTRLGNLESVLNVGRSLLYYGRYRRRSSSTLKKRGISCLSLFFFCCQTSCLVCESEFTFYSFHQQTHAKNTTVQERVCVCVCVFLLPSPHSCCYHKVYTSGHYSFILTLWLNLREKKGV